MDPAHGPAPASPHSGLSIIACPPGPRSRGLPLWALAKLSSHPAGVPGNWGLLRLLRGSLCLRNSSCHLGRISNRRQGPEQQRAGNKLMSPGIPQALRSVPATTELASEEGKQTWECGGFRPPIFWDRRPWDASLSCPEIVHQPCQEPGFLFLGECERAERGPHQELGVGGRGLESLCRAGDTWEGLTWCRSSAGSEC